VVFRFEQDVRQGGDQQIRVAQETGLRIVQGEKICDCVVLLHIRAPARGRPPQGGAVQEPCGRLHEGGRVRKSGARL